MRICVLLSGMITLSLGFICFLLLFYFQDENNFNFFPDVKIIHIHYKELDTIHKETIMKIKVS